MFPPALQSVDLLRLSFIAVLLMMNEAAAEVDSCYEVKMAYMMRQIGTAELVPDRPGTGESLRVCMHSGPSCCTGKMEDSYVAAVRSETQQKMRSYSFELKYLITGHTRAYHETFDSLVSFTSNLTSTLFDHVYAPLATDCRPLVSRLFNHIKLHLSGDPDASLEHAVHRFYNDLFPLVYRRLLNPGIGRSMPSRDPPFHSSSSSANHDDCLRLTRQDVGPFGPHPRLLVGNLARALATGRAMNRLLRMAGEVVSATEKVALSRECVQGLVRMQYCSHCRGLTLIRPCTGLCVNVMRGCLVGVSELGSPWGSLVVLLQRLAALLTSSSGHHSMELALLAVRNHVNDAILHAQLHGPRITATVEKVCGPLEASVTWSTVTSVSPATTSVTFGTSSMTPPTSPSPAALQEFQSQSRRSLPLKGSRADKPRSLKKLSREFQGSIQRYQGFLSELPEMLCESEMEVEQHTCWGGDDVVESYVGHVVGLKAQRENPEMTVRNTDHVLKGVKRRLEQLLKELHAELGWEDMARQNKEEEDGGSGQREMGSGEDCDDEDGCEGSGGMDDGGDESGGVSSGRRPAVKDVPAFHRPVTPPQHAPPPQVAVRGSAHTLGSSSHLSPLSLAVLLSLFLLLSPWEPL